MPVIFLVKLGTGVFVPVSLAYVVDDSRTRRVFTVALADVAVLREPMHPSPVERAYAERIVRQRLHQAAFRGRVLRAYQKRCAVCELNYGSLLDAAHIVPDTESRGLPITPNGLSLCKIHHAVYDQQMLGISTDYRVPINRGVLEDTDGPMLLHGIQEMHGRTIVLPKRKRDHPDRELLAWRWERFGTR